MTLFTIINVTVGVLLADVVRQGLRELYAYRNRKKKPGATVPSLPMAW